ncbi:MAG: hypothetical protein PHR38_04770 [Bacteroidales bacterium]|nr:hypothetical protein [Bacteroidales bacterium]
MRKTGIFFFTLIVAIVISIHIKQTEAQSNITIENIEALAGTEGDYVNCLYVGSVDCPKSKEKVLYYY